VSRASVALAAKQRKVAMKNRSFKVTVCFEAREDGGGRVAELVGIEGGVVSGVFNLESSGVEALDWRPRHDEQYHEA
jgi:hypothetical protein